MALSPKMELLLKKREPWTLKEQVFYLREKLKDVIDAKSLRKASTEQLKIWDRELSK